jgi:hypothetical protein
MAEVAIKKAAPNIAVLFACFIMAGASFICAFSIKCNKYPYSFIHIANQRLFSTMPFS